MHPGAIASVGNQHIRAQPLTWCTRNLDSSHQATFFQSSTVQSQWSWAQFMSSWWLRAVSIGMVGYAGLHAEGWDELCAVIHCPAVVTGGDLSHCGPTVAVNNGWMTVHHLAFWATLLTHTYYSSTWITYKVWHFQDQVSRCHAMTICPLSNSDKLAAWLNSMIYFSLCVCVCVCVCVFYIASAKTLNKFHTIPIKNCIHFW